MTHGITVSLFAGAPTLRPMSGGLLVRDAPEWHGRCFPNHVNAGADEKGEIALPSNASLARVAPNEPDERQAHTHERDQSCKVCQGQRRDRRLLTPSGPRADLELLSLTDSADEAARCLRSCAVTRFGLPLPA